MTMVGEKDQGALVRLIPDLDAAQKQVALFASQLVEEDDLVAPNGSALGDRAAFQHAVIGVVLHAGDEEGALPVEGGEPVVVVVAAVEDHDGSWLEAQRGSDAALMHAAFRQDGIAGQQALMIEQQMQFDGAFGAPVLRPVEDRSAEFDQRGVEAEQLVFEAEAVAAAHLATAGEQLIEHAAVQLLGTTFIGVGQGGASGGARPAIPGATACLRWRPARRRFRAATALDPGGRTAWPRTGPAGEAAGTARSNSWRENNCNI